MKCKFIIVCLLGLSAIGSGCSGVKEATRLDDRNRATCEAPVIGVFEAAERWTARAPALVRRGQLSRPLHGDSLIVIGDSVYFDQSRISPFVDPEPRMFANSEFVVAVSRDGRPVFGSIPDRYKEEWKVNWLLREKGDEGEATSRLVFRPQFEYCMRAGSYEILAMNFGNSEGYLVQSHSGPWAEFDVEAGATNYLGAWTLNEASAIDSLGIVFPSEIRSRPGDSAYGAAFGLIGGLLQVVIHALSDNYVEPVMTGSLEELPDPVAGLPVRTSVVTQMNRPEYIE